MPLREQGASQIKMSFLYLTQRSKRIMTIIARKTNGQFPGRKKRETNVIRPNGTDMSVVSQSNMYEGANMSKKSLRMSNYLVRISIVFFLVGVCYFLCLILASIEFVEALLSKAGVSLGVRALSFFLLKMGCSGGLALAIGFALRAIYNGMLFPELISWMDNPTVGGDGSGASSSKRPLSDLNLPPADEPEPEPSSTSDPKEGVAPRPLPLSTAEEHIYFRLKKEGGAPDAKLLDEARAICRLKEKGRSSIGWLNWITNHLNFCESTEMPL